MSEPRTTHEPLVSAVIPAWNAAETIGRAIESILEQSYSKVEVVVVNDGSPDNTAEVVAEQYPQVRLITQENSGPCVARNHGAMESSGELIAFLDSDDEWSADKLEKQVGAMLAHPEIDMLGTNGWRTVGEMRYLAIAPWPEGQKLARTRIADIFSERHPMANSVVIKREVFETLGGFDTKQKRFEDLDLMCRVIDAGYQVWSLDEPTYIAHRRGESRTSELPLATRILYGRLATLRKLDPRRHTADQPGALTVREHSRVMGRQIALAAFYAMTRDKDRDLVHECLACVDELGAPTMVMRALRWMDENDDWLLHKLLPAYGKWLNVKALVDVWGIRGTLQRMRQAKVADDRLAAQRESTEDEPCVS